MAERLSTGFVNAINQTGSVKAVMVNGVIHIYSGAQPASADDIETGTLLLIVTLDSGNFTPGSPTNGLNMDISTDGVLAKDTSETWSGNGLPAAGSGVSSGWFRWYSNSATTGASTTAVRMDGAIGTSSSYELQMTNPIIASGGPCIISVFNYTTPKQ